MVFLLSFINVNNFCLLWFFFPYTYCLYIALVPGVKLSSRSVHFGSLWFRMKELKYVQTYLSFFVLHSVFSVRLYISRTSEVMGEFGSNGQFQFVTVKVLVVICDC